ncbi:MAG: TonB-dependent receptor plug domain-containing protein [Flavobacteriaceae bacterium]|nr:TonB-dependent receptor plug domain-containing protein [Flavobacteriaceae bacterium]
MQKAASKRLLLFLLLILFTSKIIGQISSEKNPLISILKHLEEKHDIRFSYATEDVDEIFIISPSENISLEKSLAYLNEATSLNFIKINERYITVQNKKGTGLKCGIIVNSDTNLPLNGAEIKFLNTTKTTFSNKSGLFYFPTKKYSGLIKISHLGFQDIIINSKEFDKGCLSISIFQEASLLEQVLIEHYFTEGIQKNVDGSFKLNSKNNGLVPGQTENDVFQIIQVLPGIESIDESISNINIRGGTQDENLILWDGIKMYQNGHFFGLISAFNPDLTKNVTVYKNGTNARFGESVSGIVDMKSSNSLTNEIEGGVGLNLINASAFLSIPITKNLGVQVSGRSSINNIIETGVYNSYSNKIFQDTEILSLISNPTTLTVSADENFSFYDVSGKVLWDFSEKDKLRVNFLNIDNSLDFKETINETSQSKTSDLKQQSNASGISWERQWNDKISSNLLGYRSYYLLNSLNQDIFTEQTQMQENKVLETGIKLDAKIMLSEKINLQTGYHLSEVGIENLQNISIPSFTSKEKEVLRTHVLYGSSTFKPFSNKTIITSGLRVNYFSNFDEIVIEPRLSIHQKLGGGFAIETLGEFKSQTTTQRIDFQSDFLGVVKRRWTLSNNEDIPIIKSKQISLGFLYNKNDWFLNIEGFIKNVNGITTANQGFQNQFQFERSIGDYHVKGIEFVLNKKSNTLSTWFSYTYLKNDYDFPDLTPSKFPNNLDIKHSATLASSYQLNNFKVALGVNWHRGKPFTTPNEADEIINIDGVNTINFNSPNEDNLPDYFRVNISAEYLWKLSNKFDLKLNAALLNVLDRKNTINIRYALNSNDIGETHISKVEEVSLGFSPNFSFQLLF